MIQPNSALSAQRSALVKHSALAGFIPRFVERKVVVVGDLLADQFQYGEISRVSREAPVLILRHERTETVPGGAANCAVNLAALGAQVEIVGIVGADEAGRALRARLRAAGVECGEIVELAGQPTTTKTRILAGQLHSTRQQVLRIDYECRVPEDADLRAKLAARLRKAARDADALIISDYGYGVADETIAAEALEIARANKIPCLADSRFALSRFAGATAATPNQDEVEKLLNQQFTDAQGLAPAASELRARLQLQALLVTRGSDGMLLLEKDKEPLELPAVGALEPVDVTGAGDTVIAAYALALASGANFAQAAQLANHAGGLVVMKRGTASVSADELLKAVREKRRRGEEEKGEQHG
jgi:rfaE bifunctional protein kinase chain/domain